MSLSSLVQKITSLFSKDELSQVSLESMLTTENGLRYYDSIVGSGKQAQRGNRVVVHYAGWLDRQGKRGKKFDSSFKREPFVFPLGFGRVIAGWDEGVEGMREGGIRFLFIPSKLAYGEQGAGRDIPPNSDLIFEVQLLQVKET